MESIRFYDRAVAGLTRRQVLNAAWALGVAAVMPPLLSSKLWAKPIFNAYPFTPRRYGRTRCPTGRI